MDLPTAGVLGGKRRVARHRYLTVPAGGVLFACMFLPSSSSCGLVSRPVEYPEFCGPYVLGLLVAILALWSRGAARERALAIVTQIVALVSTILLLASLLFVDALLGGELAPLASTWLFFGGMAWWRDIERAKHLAAHPDDALPASPVLPVVAVVAVLTYAVVIAVAPTHPPPPRASPSEPDDSGGGVKWPSGNEWLEALHSAAHGG